MELTDDYPVITFALESHSKASPVFRSTRVALSLRVRVPWSAALPVSFRAGCALTHASGSTA